MPLLKNGEVVEDRFRVIADEEDMPADCAVIVTYERWLAEKETLSRRNTPLGVRLASGQPPALIKDELDTFALIALDFPAYTDGRAYSHARILKERLGYKGEVRAVGDVLRDQFGFMHRCGFDTLAPRDDRGVGAWDEAINEIRNVYQPACRGPETVMTLRHLKAAA